MNVVVVSFSHKHSKYEPVLALVDVKIEASTRQMGAHGSQNTWKARVGGSFELASLRSTFGGGGETRNFKELSAK